MIKSMTGYGRAEKEIDNKKITVEVSSVNHRYCDMSIRSPKVFSVFEDKIRKVIKSSISRGKLEVNIFYSDRGESDVEVVVNEAVCTLYVEALRKMGEHLALKDDLGVSDLLKLNDVITLQKKAVNQEEVWGLVEATLQEALTQLVQMRLTEGESLYTDLIQKAQDIQKIVDALEQMSPEITKHYQAKLQERLEKLLGEVPIDESRIALEIAVFADKSCIDEELTRLRSHLTQLVSILEQEEQVGRKLDFLMQEMNREANTIASKANSYQITECAVSLKTEIEKIREQIQNIE